MDFMTRYLITLSSWWSRCWIKLSRIIMIFSFTNTNKLSILPFNRYHWYNVWSLVGFYLALNLVALLGIISSSSSERSLLRSNKQTGNNSGLLNASAPSCSNKVFNLWIVLRVLEHVEIKAGAISEQSCNFLVSGHRIDKRSCFDESNITSSVLATLERWPLSFGTIWTIESLCGDWIWWLRKPMNIGRFLLLVFSAVSWRSTQHVLLVLAACFVLMFRHALRKNKMQ